MTQIGPSWKLPPWAVTALLAAVLFGLRLPGSLLPHEQNPDESQMLAQAMKYLIDPVPWRAVDGTSSGPLNSWLLSLFLIVGFKPTYILLHTLATGLMCLHVAIAHRTLLRFASPKAAALAAAAMALVYGLVQDADFIAYSSELLPVLCLAIGFYCFVRWLTQASSAFPALPLAAGIAFGCAPWCKLQALPIAIALASVFLAAIAAGKPPIAIRSKIHAAAALTGGAMLPASVILAMVWAGGAMHDFWSSYILGNLAYAGKTSAFEAATHAVTVLTSPWLLPLAALAVASVGRLSLQRRAAEPGAWVRGASIAYLAAALFAVCRPAFINVHYHILLILPLILTIAAHYPATWWGRRFRLPGTINRAALLRPLAIASASGIIVVCASQSLAQSIATLQSARSGQDSNMKLAEAVKSVSGFHPVRQLAIWGWMPGVHVLSGLPPATRDAIGHMIITRGPMQGYYRQRFLADIRRAMPDVFIDAVAGGAFLWRPAVDRPSDQDWTEDDGYESEPALKSFIEQNYVEVDRVPLSDTGKPARLFVHRGQPSASR